MYQNTISSAYPVYNPVQMQAPVMVNVPSQMQVPQVLQQLPIPQPVPMQYGMPQMPMPARDVINPYGDDVLISVKKGADDSLFIQTVRPEIKDGNTYTLTKDGTLTTQNGWSGPKLIVNNCPVMSEIYSRLAYDLSFQK